MQSSIQLLQPLVGLVIWSFVMWVWMYATRIPAIIKMDLKLDSQLPNGSQMEQLPANVRWKADNFNHLMEQPTLFYAVILALVFLNETSPFALFAAWAYVLS